MTTVYAGTLALSGGGMTIASSSGVNMVNAAGANLSLLDNETIASLGGGGTSGGNVSLGANTLTLGGNGVYTTFSGVISGTDAAGLTKTGAGTLTLNNANTFPGVTTIGAGALQLGDGSTSNGSVAGPIVDNTGLIFSNPAPQSFSGAISGSGYVTKIGAGVLTLSGQNSYAGWTSVTTGTLALSGGYGVGPASTVVLSNAAGVNLTLLDDETIGFLSGGGTSGGNVSLGANTLTLGENSSYGTFSGVISGTGGLTKTGAQNFILGGQNTYTGLTAIDGGTLTLSSGSALPTANDVVLANAAGVALHLGGNTSLGSLAGGGASGGAVGMYGYTLTVGGDNANTTFAGTLTGMRRPDQDGHWHADPCRREHL